MDTQPFRLLLIHGAIVLILGLLSGVPYWAVIVWKKSEAAVRAWRVAHTTLALCGAVMLLIGLSGTYLTMSTGLRTLLEWSFVISGYSFAFTLIVGAAVGRRALTPGPRGKDTLLFLGHFFGALGAIIGACIFLYGLL